MPYSKEQDKIDRRLNGFATQSFRDQADRDYIAARMACRAELWPQFLWSTQQAIEKYLKAILLYNRVPARKVSHDITVALQLAEAMPKGPFAIELSARSRVFIGHVATYGQNRYIETPYFVSGHVLTDLDLAVWELRRYCQALNVSGKVLPPSEKKFLLQALSNLAMSELKPRYKFRIHGGFLEEILNSRKHPARSALLWNNATYGSRKRATVRVRDHMAGENPVLYNYPEILDELLKYVSLPSKLEQAYRQHQAAVSANPGKRP